MLVYTSADKYVYSPLLSVYAVADIIVKLEGLSWIKEFFN